MVCDFIKLVRLPTMRILRSLVITLGLATGLKSAHAQIANVIPSAPPDTVPAWVSADTAQLRGTYAIGRYTSRHVLIVGFAASATQAQRQAAIDAVDGVVVGGSRGGLYIVQVSSDSTGAGLFAAQRKLRTLSQVTLVVFYQSDGIVPNSRTAQADPDSAHRIGCRFAAQVLTTGDPTPKMQWAVQVIPSCGDQGNIGTPIAAALTRLRASSDTGQLLPLRNATFGFVDGSVYSAAMSIATDDSASPTARAVNLLIVLTQVRRDAYVPYAALLSATMSETEFCPGGTTYDVPHLAGPVPLPPDAKTQALALAQRLQRNASLPTLIRVAARCVVQGAN
jgi:hypothetical protein